MNYFRCFVTLWKKLCEIRKEITWVNPMGALICTYVIQPADLVVHITWLSFFSLNTVLLFMGMKEYKPFPYCIIHLRQNGGTHTVHSIVSWPSPKQSVIVQPACRVNWLWRIGTSAVVMTSCTLCYILRKLVEEIKMRYANFFSNKMAIKTPVLDLYHGIKNKTAFRL